MESENPPQDQPVHLRLFLISSENEKALSTCGAFYFVRLLFNCDDAFDLMANHQSGRLLLRIPSMAAA
jgi:hypothetical protein